jgi:hypothetical protein
LNSKAPIELTPSTSSSAGWAAASIAARTPLMSLVTPVVVSLCTTATALIFLPVSLERMSCRMASSAPSPHGLQGKKLKQGSRWLSSRAAQHHLLVQLSLSRAPGSLQQL